jgi:glutathione S-transferase
MNHPVLWHFPISHYNEKVRWALDYKDIPHERHALFLGYLPKALWKTRQPSLPILLMDGHAIADSTRIIAAVEKRYPNPPLYPSNPAARRRALELEEFFDEELGPAVRTVVMAPLLEAKPDTLVTALGLGQKKSVLLFARTGYRLLRALYKSRHHINAETVETGHKKISDALGRIEAERQPSGYLVGDHFSIADLTAAALLYPLAQPSQFPYASPTEFALAGRRCRDSLDFPDVFHWAEEIYRLHRGISAEIIDIQPS